MILALWGAVIELVPLFILPCFRVTHSRQWGTWLDQWTLRSYTHSTSPLLRQSGPRSQCGDWAAVDWNPCRAGNYGDNGGGTVVKGPRWLRSKGSEKMHKKGLIERDHTLVWKARYKYVKTWGRRDSEHHGSLDVVKAEGMTMAWGSRGFIRTGMTELALEGLA